MAFPLAIYGNACSLKPRQQSGLSTWNFAKLINAKCYLNVVLISIYLMCEIEHLFKNLKAIRIFFSVKYSFSLAVSLLGLSR